MEKLHVAHFGATLALGASFGAFLVWLPAAPKTWPALTVAQATAIVKNVSDVVGKDEPVNIFCIDRDCNKITVALRDAGKAAQIRIKTDRPWQAEDGISVGAKTQEMADAMAKAVDKGSGGLLKPDPVANQAQTYISFGHFGGD